jgi:cytolysin (calcineurin-like family phosphatase)
VSELFFSFSLAQIDAKVDAEDLIVKVKADIDATVQAVVSVNVLGNVEGKVKTEIIGRIAAIITVSKVFCYYYGPKPCLPNSTLFY